MAVAFDIASGLTGTTSLSFSLNHAANVMVILTVAYSGTTSPSTVTCGGVAMTSLQKKSDANSRMSVEVFYLYRTSAANETISVSGFLTGTRCAGNAASYTGAANSGAASFENINTNTGTGASVQTETCNVAAGTTGRMVIGGVGYRSTTSGLGSITIAPNNGENERDERDNSGSGSPSNFAAISSQLQDFSTASAHSSDTTGTFAGKTLDWAVVAFGLLQVATETITADKWHPEINRPVFEPLGVVSY